jgi:nicotinate phosphoribosyltransferase
LLAGIVGMQQLDQRRQRDIALATDLYQMTMGASYHALNMNDRATFSLMIRKPPTHRSFLIVAGIHELLERLTNLRFDDESLDYLRSTGQIRTEFIDSLANFRFEGDVWAVPEGRVVFPNEPIVEISAPIMQAQIAETLAINSIHFAMAVASKAARCRIAAPDASLLEFGLRRIAGIEAGAVAARSAYLAGFNATSNLLAGHLYDIPVAGTVAHSFIESRPSELDAFRVFRDTFPGPVTLLIDTYDTVRGAHHAVQVAREAEQNGTRVGAVRLDSGDLLHLSREVRKILDDAGLNHIQIIASGGLDEYQLQRLTAESAPIDSYGVGTQIGNSADEPTLDMAYKLVEYQGIGRLKLSTGKISLVGAKQVWREYDDDGRPIRDVIATRTESWSGSSWEPLLQPMMRNGRVTGVPSLIDSKSQCARELDRLPESLRSITDHGHYPVELSEELNRRQEATVRQVREREQIL